MTLRDALQSVYMRHGKLTPELVVETARNPAPGDEVALLLHHRLEWDDARAAEAHRREQAAELIRSVRVVYRPASEDGEELSVRAYQNVRVEDGNVYESVEKVAQDPFLRKLVLTDMEREWKALRDRWQHFDEFTKMVLADVA